MRLLDGADLADDARAVTLARLRALQELYPQETPARLLLRARREGAAVPASRCPHGVGRSDCVACDARIGGRIYFTASGAHAHATPKCKAILKPGVSREPIQVIPVEDGPAGERERCTLCTKAPPRPRAKAKVARPA